MSRRQIRNAPQIRISTAQVLPIVLAYWPKNMFPRPPYWAMNSAKSARGIIQPRELAEVVGVAPVVKSAT